MVILSKRRVDPMIVLVRNVSEFLVEPRLLVGQAAAKEGLGGHGIRGDLAHWPGEFPGSQCRPDLRPLLLPPGTLPVDMLLGFRTRTPCQRAHQGQSGECHLPAPQSLRDG